MKHFSIQPEQHISLRDFSRYCLFIEVFQYVSDHVRFNFACSCFVQVVASSGPAPASRARHSPAAPLLLPMCMEEFSRQGTNSAGTWKLCPKWHMAAASTVLENVALPCTWPGFQPGCRMAFHVIVLTEVLYAAILFGCLWHQGNMDYFGVQGRGWARILNQVYTMGNCTVVAKLIIFKAQLSRYIVVFLEK